MSVKLEVKNVKLIIPGFCNYNHNSTLVNEDEFSQTYCVIWDVYTECLKLPFDLMNTRLRLRR